MDTYSKRLVWLFERYMNGTLTDDESLEFLEHLGSDIQKDEIRRLINTEIVKADNEKAVTDQSLSSEKADIIFERILQFQQRWPSADSGPIHHDGDNPGVPQIENNKTGRIKRVVFRFAAAASVLCILGASLYWFQLNGFAINGRHNTKAGKIKTYDVAPGRNNAIITLSDGSRINLDSAADGLIGQEENTAVVKVNGQISYKSGGINRSLLYNTVSTARGNQYALVLPDGTKVWLNAESAITFPTAFTDNERQVKISGEAYLEVARQKNRPFRVSFGDGATIEVLGTHFNINSYKDESQSMATLVEGKIKIIRKGRTQSVEPGEQAILKSDGRFELVRGVDVDAAVAWKNGFFSFRDANIQTIMTQLARWYDLDIRYEGPVGKERFTGEIDRTLTLVSVLKILEKTKVHYKLGKNNKLVILP